MTRTCLRADEQSWGVLLGAVFGTVHLWSGLQVHQRVSERIGRAFFRSAYDARVIVKDLAAQSAAASDRAAPGGMSAGTLFVLLQPIADVARYPDVAALGFEVASKDVDEALADALPTSAGCKAGADSRKRAGAGDD